MTSLKLKAHQMEQAGETAAAAGLRAALTRIAGTGSAKSTASAPAPKRAVSGVPMMEKMTGAEIARVLSAEQRASIAKELAPTSKTVPAKPMVAATPTPKPQTAAEARTEIRAAIAESQGKTLPPAPAVLAPAPKGNVNEVWGNAIAANNPGYIVPGHLVKAAATIAPAKAAATSPTSKETAPSQAGQSVWGRAISANWPNGRVANF